MINRLVTKGQTAALPAPAKNDEVVGGRDSPFFRDPCGVVAPRRFSMPMPISEYQHISYRNVDGVAVVNFMETVAMFDSDKVREVGDELLDLVERKRFTKLVLNLTNARFISRAMLAHLVKLHRQVQEMKGKIRLCCLRPVIMDAFKVSNFDRLFEILPDEAAALKKF
jgi:anti-sigma B factor antagonist